jgi:hypothetical protein
VTELIAGGASRDPIVTPGRFTPVENHAAENPQVALYRMTGVRLPVRWARQRLPERRTRRDLEFAGDAKPAGHWQLIPSSRPFTLQGTFPAEQVQHTRLVLNQRRGSVFLQLVFNPQTIPPGGSTVVWTTWQFPG